MLQFHDILVQIRSLDYGFTVLESALYLSYFKDIGTNKKYVFSQFDLLITSCKYISIILYR
jgi:hypothetical protein